MRSELAILGLSPPLHSDGGCVHHDAILDYAEKDWELLSTST
jgi:hypothetical protein